METFIALAQLIIAGSVFFVWVSRLPNVEREFREYQLSDLVRNAVGASKIAAATLLEPILIVGMGIVVIVIMLSVLLPIIQLRSWVGG